MRLQDIMTASVLNVAPDGAAEEAWTTMQVHKVHHLVVVEEGRVVGVISDRDLGGPRGTHRRVGTTVGELMTESVVTASPTTTVREAANLMRGHVIGCLPIVDGQRLVGIVTVADLLELIGRGVEKPVARSKRYTLRHEKTASERR